MLTPELRQSLAGWTLPAGGPLLDRIERMVRPALWKGAFDSDAVLFGLQYHLSGEQDTSELAELAGIRAADHVAEEIGRMRGPLGKRAPRRCQAWRN
jgi:hypothetical protein